MGRVLYNEKWHIKMFIIIIIIEELGQVRRRVRRGGMVGFSVFKTIDRYLVFYAQSTAKGHIRVIMTIEVRYVDKRGRLGGRGGMKRRTRC